MMITANPTRSQLWIEPTGKVHEFDDVTHGKWAMDKLGVAYHPELEEDADGFTKEIPEGWMDTFEVEQEAQSQLLKAGWIRMGFFRRGHAAVVYVQKDSPLTPAELGRAQTWIMQHPEWQGPAIDVQDPKLWTVPMADFLAAKKTTGFRGLKTAAGPIPLDTKLIDRVFRAIVSNIKGYWGNYDAPIGERELSIAFSLSATPTNVSGEERQGLNVKLVFEDAYLSKAVRGAEVYPGKWPTLAVYLSGKLTGQDITKRLEGPEGFYLRGILVHELAHVFDHIPDEALGVSPKDNAEAYYNLDTEVSAYATQLWHYIVTNADYYREGGADWLRKTGEKGLWSLVDSALTLRIGNGIRRYCNEANRRYILQVAYRAMQEVLESPESKAASLKLAQDAGITKADLQRIRPILREWVGGGWSDGPQLMRLLEKHKDILAKFRMSKPVRLWRNERAQILTRGGQDVTGPSNAGWEDQYTRPSAWSATRMHAESYASGNGRRLVTAIVPPEDTYCYIPLVEQAARALGMKTFDPHQQDEVIVRPNPSFLDQIRPKVTVGEEAQLRRDYELALVEYHLPQLHELRKTNPKAISDEELKRRIADIAKHKEIHDVRDELAKLQRGKAARKNAGILMPGFNVETACRPTRYRAMTAAQALHYQPKRVYDGDVLVTLDVAKVDASWRRDKTFYIEPGGGNQLRGRYDRFAQWLQDNQGTPIDPPDIGLTPSGEIIFGNGRHRWAVLRDMGEKRIPAMVAREDLKAMQEKFGAGQAKAAGKLRAYHGTNKTFDAFDLSKAGQGRGAEDEAAIFFSLTPETANHSAEVLGADGGGAQVYPVYLTLNKPYASPMRHYNTAEMVEEIRRAKKHGFDGITFPNMEGQGEADTVAVWSPEQVQMGAAKVASKTLYHGTSVENAKSIQRHGLEPQVGDLTATAYEDDAESVGEELEPLTFAGDKEALQRGVYSAMLHAIQAEGHDISDPEQAIRNWGALVILKDGDEAMEYRHPDDGVNNPTEHPMQVEPGDFYSRDNVAIDYILTGPTLVRYLKRHGVNMERWTRPFSEQKRNALVGMVRRAHPDVPVEKIVEKVNALTFEQFHKSWDYYSALPTSKAASTKLLYWGGRPGATHLVPKNTEYRAGIWLTDSIKVAASFGTEIYLVEVTGLNNPLVVDAQGEFYSEIPTPQILKDEGFTFRDTCTTDNIVAYALTKGYDSVIIQNVTEGFSGGGVGLSHQTGTDYVLLKEGQARIVSSFDYKSTLDVWGMPKDPKLASKNQVPADGENVTPWDLAHIAVAQDDELADAIIEYVQSNFEWSKRPDLRDRLLKLIRKCPPFSRTLYRAEEPYQGGSPENGQRGFRSWTLAHDTAVYLGNHMVGRDFVVRTTGGAPVKALSIDDFHYWHGRIHGYAGSGTAQAEFLVLDSSVPKRVWKTDVRWQKMASNNEDAEGQCYCAVCGTEIVEGTVCTECAKTCQKCGGPTRNCKCASFVHAKDALCHDCWMGAKTASTGGLYPPTPEWINAARTFVFQKWKERAAERGTTEPVDLDNACKFASMFAQRVFGGSMSGNWHHQFVRLDDGQIIDLTKGSGAFARWESEGVDPYVHDKRFWGNREHRDSLRSIEPRVAQWLVEWRQTHPLPQKTASTVGFNVNDSEMPWTEMILAGRKTIETRDSDSLRPHVGERVGIVRTGQGPATLVGYCVLGEPKVYRTNAEFRADNASHRIPDGPQWDLQPGAVKFGYPLADVEACEPKRVEGQGRVFRRIAAPLGGAAWQHILSRFPKEFQAEVLAERSGKSLEDIQELQNWRLTSRAPVVIPLNAAFIQQQCEAMHLPAEVVQRINEVWGLGLRPSGQVYDPNPERYFRYAQMPAATANPSIMLGPDIVWGVGRFVAACLRGDRSLRVWKLRQGKSASFLTKDDIKARAREIEQRTGKSSRQLLEEMHVSQDGDAFPGFVKEAKPIEVPGELLDALVSTIVPFLETEAATVPPEQWAREVSAGEARWSWHVGALVQRHLGDVGSAFPQLRMQVGFDKAKRFPQNRVTEAWSDPSTGVISILMAQPPTYHPIPTALVADLRQSLAHELAHLQQAVYQGVGAYTNRMREIAPTKNPDTFINTNYEVKAISAEFAEAFSRALHGDPTLSVEQFLSTQWQWPHIQEGMAPDARARILKDLAYVATHASAPKRGRRHSDHGSHRRASQNSVFYHGTRHDGPKPGLTGILWLTEDLHAAAVDATTHAHHGDPGCWKLTLDPQAHLVALWDLDVPAVRTVKDEASQHHAHITGRGVTDEEWVRASANGPRLETLPWMLRRLLDLGVDGVYVHEPVAGRKQLALALLNQDVVTSQEPAPLTHDAEVHHHVVGSRE